MSTIDTTAPEQGDQPIPSPVGLRRRDEISDSQWSYDVDSARDTRDTMAAGMRELLDVIRAADLTWPDNVFAWGWNHRVKAQWDAPDLATFESLRRAIGSTISTPWVKDTDYGKATVTRDVSTVLTVTIRALWGTCEQVETGDTVTVVRSIEVCPLCESDLDVRDDGRKVCADDHCFYDVQPAKRVTREVVEPETEWRCPDLADL